MIYKCIYIIYRNFIKVEGISFLAQMSRSPSPVFNWLIPFLSVGTLPEGRIGIVI